MCPNTEQEAADEIRACQAAEACPNFRLDDEDEQVSDEDLTCLNCRYRRWTQKSFECLKA